MKPVDKFGYPFEDYAEHISPEVEQRFKDVATMILYEAFRNNCTNPRDLGLHLMNIVREAQKDVSYKLHWAEQNIAWSRKKASDLSWKPDREEIVKYAKT